MNYNSSSPLGILLHWIVPAFAEGVAATDSPEAFQGADQGAAFLDRFDEVTAARRVEPALSTYQGRQYGFVESNEGDESSSGETYGGGLGRINGGIRRGGQVGVGRIVLLACHRVTFRGPCPPSARRVGPVEQGRLAGPQACAGRRPWGGGSSPTRSGCPGGTGGRPLDRGA